MAIMEMRPRTGENANHYRGLHAFAEMLYAPKTLIQCGAWTGEASVIFAQYCGQVVDYDPWDGPLPAGTPYTFEDVYAAYLERVSGLRNVAHFRAPFEAASCWPLASFDAAYVDGSHQYPNVLRDNRRALQLVKPGGTIGGHDYDMHGVKKAVHEVFGLPHAVFEDNSWMWRVPDV